VEFALVLPLLLMILFGMITTGLAFSDHLSATNAVREGARYGAAASFASPSSPSGWATSVRQRLKDVYFNSAGATVTDAQICVKLVNSAGTVSGTALSGASCGTAPTVPNPMAAGSCAVVVWMERPQTIQLLVFPDLNFDIHAESVAYYGRKVSPCTAQ
jgi:Flp pilus assembly protein TadG